MHGTHERNRTLARAGQTQTLLFTDANVISTIVVLYKRGASRPLKSKRSYLRKLSHGVPDETQTVAIVSRSWTTASSTNGYEQQRNSQKRFGTTWLFSRGNCQQQYSVAVARNSRRRIYQVLVSYVSAVNLWASFSAVGGCGHKIRLERSRKDYITV